MKNNANTTKNFNNDKKIEDLTDIMIDLHKLIKPTISDRHRKEEILLLKRIQRNLRKHKTYFF